MLNYSWVIIPLVASFYIAGGKCIGIFQCTCIVHYLRYTIMRLYHRYHDNIIHVNTCIQLFYIIIVKKRADKFYSTVF